MIYIMKTVKFFINKKYRIFLFLPLAAIAVSYLIGATDISYILNVPMIMSPVRVGMPMNTERAGQSAGKPLSVFLKTAGHHSNKLSLQSCVTCVECQNLPAGYRPVMFYYGGIIKAVSPKRQFYIKHFSSGIPHPPQNTSAV